MSSSGEVKLPSLPRYDLNRVFLRRDAVMVVLKTRLGDLLKLEDYSRLCHSISEVFGSSVDGRVIHESCMELLGRKLKREDAWEAAWRLAGNALRLNRKIPVLKYVVQPSIEWVPMQIQSARRHITRKGRDGHIFEFQILAGTSASWNTSSFWTYPLCGLLATDRIGFARRQGPYQYLEPKQLVGCRVYGLVRPSKCADGEVGFHEVGASSGMTTYNKKLILRRSLDYRLDTRSDFTCPHNYKHDCHRCFRGYLAGEDGRCPLAVSPTTLVTGECNWCKKEKMLDADSKGNYCHECRIRRLKDGIRHSQL